ncbi:hypothetical protein [Pseudomonas nicosulfuronedens]
MCWKTRPGTSPQAPRVEVISNDRHGQKARLFVGGLDLDSRTALANRLGGYAVHIALLES